MAYQGAVSASAEIPPESGLFLLHLKFRPCEEGLREGSASQPWRHRHFGPDNSPYPWPPVMSSIVPLRRHV